MYIKIKLIFFLIFFNNIKLSFVKMCKKRISFSEDVKMHDGTSERVVTYTTLLFDFFGFIKKKHAKKNIKRKKITNVWDVFEITTNLEDIIFTIKEVKNLISNLESSSEEEEDLIEDPIEDTSGRDEDCTISDTVYVKGVGFISDIKMPNGDIKRITNKFPYKYYISEKKIDVDWEHDFFNYSSSSKKKTKLKKVSICRHGSLDLGGKLLTVHLPMLWSFLCLLEESHNELQLMELSKII